MLSVYSHSSSCPKLPLPGVFQVVELGGLNPHSLQHLNTWFKLEGIAGGDLGVETFQEEVTGVLVSKGKTLPTCNSLIFLPTNFKECELPDSPLATI